MSSVAESSSCPVMQTVQPPESSPVVSTVVSGASSARAPPTANHLVETVASVTQPSELLQQKGTGELHSTICVAHMYTHTGFKLLFLRSQTV